MQDTQLKRVLSPRQVRFIALGAAIGVGLFLGSASAIKLAGPSVLIAYLFAGGIIFLIMRALGELAVDNPVSGSFSTYASRCLGPFAGFLTGWNYWIMNIGVGIAEITAVGIYMKLWFPDVPQWIWALAAVGMIGALNLITVKLYGELEFRFALVKVATMVLLIAGGTAMIVTGWGNGGHPISVSSLWAHGGWFPHGVSGLLMSLLISANGVPVRGALLSLACLLVGVLLNYLAPESVFGWLMALLSFTAIWTWATVLVTHYRFRVLRKQRNQPAAAFPMLVWLLSSWIALLFLAFLICTMAADGQSRVSLFAGLAWIAFLGVIYKATGLGASRLPVEDARSQA